MISSAQSTDKGAVQSVSASNTFAAAGSESVTATLPGGAIGRPLWVRASGSVSGEVDMLIGNGAKLVVPVNPNAPYTELAVPAAAFPSKVASVTLTLVGDGAGVVRAIVGFSA